MTGFANLSPVKQHNQRVILLGLDFGSTTSSALVASSKVIISSATGRMEFSDIQILFRSTPVFTPFFQQNIVIDSIRTLIQYWLDQSHLKADDIFSGGSIITGLAAKAHNAELLKDVIREIIGDCIIAAADDPNLESWLAFMGSSSALSRYHINTHILNIDIGGGTSNVAIGLNGEVLDTACYFIGARHFQFVEGTYELIAMSEYGKAILQAINISASIGDTLTSAQCDQIIGFYTTALEAIILNDPDFWHSSLAQIHCQVSMLNHYTNMPAITFSGGVGELLYQYAAGESLPSTTYFGDFGIDLARAIAHSPILSVHLQSHIPENKGRATVYGLTLHSTEISGHTIYLPKPDVLPLRDIPIIAKLAFDSPNEHWQSAFTLLAQHNSGACIQILEQKSIDSKQAPEYASLDNIRLLAKKIRLHYARSGFASTLLILVSTNIGKALGNYISDWGQSMQNIIVIDEVPLRNAHFVNIGRLHQQLVPVSFFGMH